MNFIDVKIRFVLISDYFLTLCALVLSLFKNLDDVTFMFLLSCEFVGALCTLVLNLFMLRSCFSFLVNYLELYQSETCVSITNNSQERRNMNAT